MTRRRRLIEVAFPLEEVSAHSRREKNVRHGHISTLHIWWARRPLAACRAFIYASLVDDCNGGKPPASRIPSPAGGAIPLEALRLGCGVEASDLNPVAVLILKGTVEYPQKYGRPLAEQRAQLARGERDSIAGVNGKIPGYIRSENPLGQTPLPASGRG